MTMRARPSSLPALLPRLAPVLALCLGVALSLAAPRAHADIYGYIDAAGNAHFAAEAIDARYRLFMRGDGALDSSRIGPGMPAAKASDSPLMRYLGAHPNLKKYEAMVDRAAAEFRLEPALIKAIMAAESGFDPNAVSPKGAVGLMQIMPATAQRYGLQADKKRTLHQKLTDPAINIRLAAHYLHDLKEMFPQRLELAVASYNAGEGAVQKYRNQIPPYPETRNYVQLVEQFYQLYAPGGEIAAAPRDGPARITMIIPGRRSTPAPITVSSGG
jgi:soluble lytic murein transglycosylase-like protein